LDRYNFYKKNGIYLIWVLDSFKKEKKSPLVKHIQYLTQFENIFRLDESTSELKLRCIYKSVKLTDTNKLITPWVEQSIKLSELKFNTTSNEVYFYNYPNEKVRALKRQKLIEIENKKSLAEEERKRIEEEKKRELNRAKERAKQIRDNIRIAKNSKPSMFVQIQNDIKNLNELERKELNKVLNLKKENFPILQWIQKMIEQL
jgi:hypothetical protein